MRLRTARYLFATALVPLVPAKAYAQASDSTTLIQPAIPEGFDRDRNVSVAERPRPDYDPLGIRLSSFILTPRIETGIGATSNVYVTDINPVSDGFVYFAPSLAARSDWSRHEVQLRTGTQLRRFFDQPRRNENPWDLSTLGRLDLGTAYSVTGEAQVARVFESPLTGGIQANFAVLSSYLRAYQSVRGEYKSGQVRAVLAFDRNSFSFSDIPLANGTRINQQDRDRVVLRGAAQGEYAFTPSVSAYGQISYERTSYSQLLRTGLANRDSNAVRALAGFNFDLAGLFRGTIGVGYVRRDYDSPLYKMVDGLSVEGRIEYFPTQLTTVTLSLRRFIEDANVGTTNAFFDNRVGLRVDHELLNNLLFNLEGNLIYQDYIGLNQNVKTYNIIGGGKYLVSRRLTLLFTTSYTHRDNSNQGVLGQSFGEVRGQAGAVFGL